MASLIDNKRQNSGTTSKTVLPKVSADLSASFTDSKGGMDPSSSSTIDNGTGKDSWVNVGSYSVNPFGSMTSNSSVIRKSSNALSDVIDAVSTMISIVKSIGALVNAFQTDVNNIFKVLDKAIQALLDALDELAVSISSTGIYILPVLPSSSPFTPDEKAGGGFNEFKAKVSSSLINKKDPNRPIFYEGDFIGGIVIALTAGTNLGDLIEDMLLLSKLVSGVENQGQMPPVVGLTATPGLYYKTDGKATSLTGTLSDYLSAIGGQKFPGIRLSWSSPSIIPVTAIAGYHIYRSKDKTGVVSNKDKSKGVPNAVANPGVSSKEYADPTFNKGAPLFVKCTEIKMSYVDFDVVDGQTYYYRVVPLVKAQNGEYTEGFAVSGFVSAVANSCIPSEVLRDAYKTPDGLLKVAPSGGPPYWSNITLRGLLGESMDHLLGSIHGIADRLKGVMVSGSVHFNDMMDLLSAWVAKIKEILDKLKEVLESLQALQFSASAMYLKIPSEYGGISGFKNRFNSATMSSSLQKANDSDLCSVYAGLVLLVGWPTDDSIEKLSNLTSEEYEKVKKAGNLEKTKKAAKNVRDEYRKGATRAKEKGMELKKEYMDGVLSQLLSIFGG